MAVPARLEQFRATWLGRLRSPVFWCCLWGLLLAAACLSQVARTGTSLARAVSGGALAGGISMILILAWREGRQWQDPRRIIRRVLFAVSRPLGERVLRAHDLVERAPQRAGESEELARLHYERLLEQASQDAVAGAAQRRARLWRAAWIVCALGTAGFALTLPLHVIEGMNVLFARDGRAPLEFSYLADPIVTVELPAYLRESRRSLVLSDGTNTLPEGSIVTVRGTPRVGGRELVLTDGLVDAPLVSDGQGGLVAHYTVRDPVTLRVAARFGDVRIFDPLERTVAAMPDRAPMVVLEGAPRSEELGTLERLELRFVASDDHGLDQIDLVLRSGRREERRPLVKLSGEERLHRGGHALTPDDPFLRRVFLPVAITIEARDNDTATGPKWGRSAAITLTPPAVGAPEAARHESLKAIREALVHLVAVDQTSAGRPLAQRAKALQSAENAVRTALDQSLAQRPGGLPITRAAQLFLEAQVESLSASEKRRPAPDNVLLAVDVLLDRLVTQDARGVSTRLGDVVEELAVRLKLAREGTEQDAAGIGSVLQFAGEGAAALSKLGTLGRDLGSVAEADLGRVRRLVDGGDLRRAELAARHLAARLRRPEPSFGAAGGGGVESGAPSRGQGRPSQAPSEAPGEFEQLSEQIDELAGDHAQQMSELDRLLREAEQAAKPEDQKRDARRRAEALREAVAPLPEVGSDPGSARAAAAEGRAHGEAMADSLERLDLAEAVESGKRALEALEEAGRRRGDGSGSWLNPEDLEQARERVRSELGQAERELRQLRERTRDQLQGDLGKRADQQQELARRAQELARRGRESTAPLPGEIVQNLEDAARLMREAARELNEGDAERAHALQQEAQRRLERSRTGSSPDGDERPNPPPQRDAFGDRGDMAREGEVPGAREKNAAAEFRERLQRGLGQPSGRLAPAVRRYAESLQ